ncbi:serine protein kinase RIO [Nonomuraea sp. NEAU-A123]|uniref:serine protein kinase RIO n=1 Tax=Nonomuraea sp. NEAU-A123 TaxID=2839649 RepID=UPI001BE460E5|nr:RIO1 family regulatory kinase/ATPase [Nonomuraea sp. NEAU-A123]MBT2228641.1 RIO-like kinase [Nonomuraea sp. NEAU-A123]
MPKHSSPRRRGKYALDADDLEWLDSAPVDDGPPVGDRWSTWDQSTPTERGPKPHPDWLITELAAVDTELGILKTGKEADVHLVSRGVPDTDRVCLLAAKRYRSAEHRLFHRDAGYLEGRSTRESRMNRAMANRTAFGKQLIAGQWAAAEFGALCRLTELGLPVPYPVQIVGTEILQEFIGTSDGYAAPRLANVSDDLDDLWAQLVEALVVLAREGLAHGDLSAYNLLVREGRLVIIDLPQIVDVISHPTGPRFLDRDARNVATWFAAKGVASADPDALSVLLQSEAGML